MNVFFVIYDEITGAIKRTGSAPQSMIEIQAQPGERVAQPRIAVSSETHYVSDVALGLIAEKPPLGAAIDKTTLLANGVDAVTLSSLPNPTAVSIRGPVSDRFTVADGTLVQGFDYVGEYEFELTALHRLPQKFTVIAT